MFFKYFHAFSKLGLAKNLTALEIVIMSKKKSRPRKTNILLIEQTLAKRLDLFEKRVLRIVDQQISLLISKLNSVSDIFEWKIEPLVENAKWDIKEKISAWGQVLDRRLDGIQHWLENNKL